MPPAWGYGDKEIGPIPAGSTLLFEVEALKVATPPSLGGDSVFGARSEGSLLDVLILLLVVGIPVGGYWYATKYMSRQKKKTGTPKAVKKLAKKLAAQKEKSQ